MFKLVIAFTLLIISNSVVANIELDAGFQRLDISQSISLYRPSEMPAMNLATAQSLFQADGLFTHNTASTILLGNADNGYWLKGKITTKDFAENNVALRLHYGFSIITWATHISI